MGQFCPPCINCAFPVKGEAGSVSVARTIVSEAAYGCVRRDGGALVETGDGQVGLLRQSGFYPITEEGVRFHRSLALSPLGAVL